MITEGSLISLSLAIVIAGGAWWTSDFYTEFRFTKREVSEIKEEVKVLAEVRSDQKVIMEVIKRLESPVIRTNANVKRVRKAIEFAQAPFVSRRPHFEVCSPFNQGPYSMNESGQN